MTDKQLLNVILKRASAHIPNVDRKLINVILTQQYSKKLYFGIRGGTHTLSLLLTFSRNGKTTVFLMPELPERLMKWKHETIATISTNTDHFINFDLDNCPKEVIHLFFSAIISALNTPGMSVGFIGSGTDAIFGPDETYEEVSVEADLMSFNEDF